MKTGNFSITKYSSSETLTWLLPGKKVLPAPPPSPFPSSSSPSVHAPSSSSLATSPATGRNERTTERSSADPWREREKESQFPIQEEEDTSSFAKSEERSEIFLESATRRRRRRRRKRKRERKSDREGGAKAGEGGKPFYSPHPFLFLRSSLSPCKVESLFFGRPSRRTKTTQRPACCFLRPPRSTA